ncbi:MAG TPA: NYN domain-containing protein [Streptosporangiaceae bacterium]|nr:NYN domain-containing protein [Streptosporangiaceae bacterium]
MDRCALFVDASYALADGALVVHGTRNRDSVSWDYAGLLKLLGGLSRDRTGLPLLRCYWYDTSTDGNRTTEHDAIADVPGVKLRLSKIRPSRKEGVEAEIRRDLTALARNHAISDVIIVSAEEDLGPVIAEVQDLGVRATLLYIGADGDLAVSRTLRQECDDVLEISAGHLRPYVDLIAGAEPQLTDSGFRELTANAAHASGPHAAIEAPAQHLYSSPLVPPDYERIAQPQLADLRTSRPADGMNPGPGQGELASHTQPSHAQLEAQRYQRPDDGRGQPSGGGDGGFTAPAFPAQEPARAQGGQSQNGFGQRLLPEAAPGQVGSMPGVGGMPTAAPPGTAGHQGQGGDGPVAGGAASAGTGMAMGRHQDNGMQLANGVQPNGLQPAGQQPAGMQPMAQQPGGMQQSNGVQQQGSQHFGAPGASLTGRHQETPREFGGSVSLPGTGQMQPGQPYGQGPQGLAQPGLPAQPQPSHGQQLPSQNLAGQGVPGQGNQPASQQVHGASSVPPHVMHQNGQASVEAQRSALTQRSLPAGNGVQYPPDRTAPYGGQAEPAQFASPPNNTYLPNPYGGQPAIPPAAAMSVGDAVQSAHAEGFGFGEAVARDAPALWLEAVLARKPRMPSDLEARLLQGSALPIDSLLHDEVRHALRRGFWDALERSRH